jgi:2-C-methyl-D-erythritol 2,4-cyclodiphosphate synthase
VAGVRLSRSGIGHDSHPFGPAAPLRLGGITIEGAGRLHGHSDGDVVLHAIADALLGASGLGDLGRMFPADARTPAGIAGAELIHAVRDRLAVEGWAVGFVDVTIRAGRPRLGPYLDAMRLAIAADLGVEPTGVNVKASSGNLDGSDGAGRSISAIAIATITAG